MRGYAIDEVLARLIFQKAQQPRFKQRNIRRRHDETRRKPRLNACRPTAMFVREDMIFAAQRDDRAG